MKLKKFHSWLHMLQIMSLISGFSNEDRNNIWNHSKSLRSKCRKTWYATIFTGLVQSIMVACIVRIYIFVHVRAGVCACVSVCLCACVSVCLCACVCVCVLACAVVNIHICCACIDV